MRTNETIKAARKHLGRGCMTSAARSYLEQAVLQQSKGDLRSAKASALASLAYSVGTTHSDYVRALNNGRLVNYLRVAAKPAVGYILQDPRGYYFGVDFGSIGRGYYHRTELAYAFCIIYKTLRKRVSLQEVRRLMK